MKIHIVIYLLITLFFSSCGLTETKAEQLISEGLDKEVVKTAIRIGKWNLSDSGDIIYGVAVSSYSQLKLLEKAGAVTATVSLGPKRNIHNFTAQDVVDAIHANAKGKDFKFSEHRDKIIHVQLTPSGIAKYKLSLEKMGPATVASFQSYRKQKLLEVHDLKINRDAGTATCTYTYEIIEPHPLYTLLYGENNKIQTGHASFVYRENKGWILN